MPPPIQYFQRQKNWDVSVPTRSVRTPIVDTYIPMKWVKPLGLPPTKHDAVSTSCTRATAINCQTRQSTGNLMFLHREEHFILILVLRFFIYILLIWNKFFKRSLQEELISLLGSMVTNRYQTQYYKYDIKCLSLSLSSTSQATISEHVNCDSGETSARLLWRTSILLGGW